MSNTTINPTFTIIPVADDQNKHSTTLQAAETLHRSLRPNLPDDYAGYMRKMFSEGAGMAVLMVEGKAKSIAVYRSFHTTFQGHRFYFRERLSIFAFNFVKPLN